MCGTSSLFNYLSIRHHIPAKRVEKNVKWVYPSIYRHLNMLLPLTLGFPRFYRYSGGIRMVDLNLDMLSLLFRANSVYEKTVPLVEFLDKYQTLLVLFRLCVEQHVTTERKYAEYALLMERTGKQATC